MCKKIVGMETSVLLLSASMRKFQLVFIPIYVGFLFPCIVEPF